MNQHPLNGQLAPVGGGDPISPPRPVLVVGRLAPADVCLPFPKVSGRHCELTFREGYWYVRDLGSTNGTKVNGMRVQEKMVRDGDEISIGKHKFIIEYDFPSGHSPLVDEDIEDVMSQPLLEKAGLIRPRRERRPPRFAPSPPPPEE